MTFKASLTTNFKIHNFRLPTDTALEFTKSHIIFPKSLANGHYDNINIKHGAHYELIVHDNINLRERYEIKLDNNEKIRLAITRKNEKILKSVHKLYRHQKYPVKYDILKAAITGILSISLSLLIGLVITQKSSGYISNKKSS